MDLATLEFPGAVAMAAKGDLGPLLKALRDPSLEITMEDREFLARFLAGDLRRRRGRQKEGAMVKLNRALDSDVKRMSVILKRIRPEKSRRKLDIDFPQAQAIFRETFGHDPKCTVQQVRDLNRQTKDRRL